MAKIFTATLTDVIGTVTFAAGIYRGEPVVGDYDLVKDFQAGGNGVGFVTVRETDGKKTRITVLGEGQGYTVALTGETVEAEESVEATRSLSFAEAAEQLGITRDALRKRVSRGTLETVEVDGEKRIVL